MEADTQAKADAAAAALQHDMELLEHEAAKAGKTLARKLAPAIAALLVLVLVAWLLGRRSRNRG